MPSDRHPQQHPLALHNFPPFDRNADEWPFIASPWFHRLFHIDVKPRIKKKDTRRRSSIALCLDHEFIPEPRKTNSHEYDATLHTRTVHHRHRRCRPFLSYILPMLALAHFGHTAPCMYSFTGPSAKGLPGGKPSGESIVRTGCRSLEEQKENWGDRWSMIPSHNRSSARGQMISLAAADRATRRPSSTVEDKPKQDHRETRSPSQSFIHLISHTHISHSYSAKITVSPIVSPLPFPAPKLDSSSAPTLDYNIDRSTSAPIPDPSVILTIQPSSSFSPSFIPTAIPTFGSTTIPSISPSMWPTASPSTLPSTTPSVFPTVLPTVIPTVLPSAHPSVSPTLVPSNRPSTSPSVLPSSTPTARQHIKYACKGGIDGTNAVWVMRYRYELELLPEIDADIAAAKMQDLCSKWLALDVMTCSNLQRARSSAMRRREGGRALSQDGNIIAVQTMPGDTISLDESCQSQLSPANICVVVSSRLILTLSDGRFSYANHAAMSYLRQNMLEKIHSFPEGIVRTVIIHPLEENRIKLESQTEGTTSQSKMSARNNNHTTKLAISTFFTVLGISGVFCAIFVAGRDRSVFPNRNHDEDSEGEILGVVPGSPYRRRSRHRSRSRVSKKHLNSKRLQSIKPSTSMHRQSYRDGKGKAKFRTVFIANLDSIPEETEEDSVSSRSVGSARRLFKTSQRKISSRMSGWSCKGKIEESVEVRLDGEVVDNVSGKSEYPSVNHTHNETNSDCNLTIEKDKEADSSSSYDGPFTTETEDQGTASTGDASLDDSVREDQQLIQKDGDTCKSIFQNNSIAMDI